MKETTHGKPCAGECGRTAIRGDYCSECLTLRRRARWREKNPTFRDMVEMNDLDFMRTIARLARDRGELHASKQEVAPFPPA